MKALKVRIVPGTGEAEGTMAYPSAYKGKEVDGRGLGVIGYSGDISRGGTEAWCLIAVDDALAAVYAADPDMEIVTRTQAEALLEQWRIAKGEPDEQVNDPDRLTAIIAKQGAGIALSAEDLDALDPTNATAGIVKQSVQFKQTLKDVSNVVAIT